MIRKGVRFMYSWQRSQCDEIIAKYKARAGIHGSNFGLSSLVTDMCVEIGYVFGYDVSGGLPSELREKVFANAVGSGANKLLTGWIPLVGKAVSHASSAMLTEDIGKDAVRFFDAL